MHAMHPAPSHYRPDIDGLRALAVGMVVAFHAFPALAPGGFIGVDVFFVISGYLISGLILGGLHAGRFSFAQFYSRRLRRIAPALLAVLAACAGLGLWLLHPDEMAQLGNHIVGGAGFVANLLLWNESGYFDTEAQSKPLLHLWSLAIEEQFYLAWPLLLVLLHRHKCNIARATLAITLASFAVNIYDTQLHETAASYYSPFGRMWELMLGSLLALRVLPAFSARARNLQSLTGLALLAVAMLGLDKDSPYPGALALLPTCATALLIAAGPQALVNRQLLSRKYVVALGLVSYPLYLWHWPLLVFARTAFYGELSTQATLAVLLASLALAIATYRGIERPLRARAPMPRLLCLLLALAAATGAAMAWTGHQQARNTPPSPAALNDRFFNFARISDGSCPRLLKRGPAIAQGICITNSPEPSLLVVGDSHAMAMASAIFARRIPARAVLIAGHGCPLYANLDYSFSNSPTDNRHCREIAQEAQAMARLPAIKTVLLVHSSGTYIYNPRTYYKNDGQAINAKEAFVTGTGDMANRLLALHKDVTLVIDAPHLPANPGDCVRRSSLGAAKDCTTPLATVLTAQKEYREAITAVAALAPGLKIFDTATLFCSQTTCAPGDAQGFYYNDNHHLSVHGSEKLLPAILKK